MVCSHCSREIAEHSNYCSFCGSRVGPTTSYRRLTLSRTDSKIAGVCGGISEYLNVDSTVVRLVWAVLSVFPGGFVGGVFAYLFAWIIIPKAPLPGTAPITSPSVGQAAKT
jgi:phage shock protein C